MRVLQVLPPSAGGMKRMVELLAPGLERRAVSCETCAMSVAGNAFGNSGRTPSAGFDMIHAHGYRAACAIGRAVGSRIPWLWTAHNLFGHNVSWPQRRAMALLLKWRTTSARTAICVSNAVADSLISNGFPSDSLCTIYNGIPIPSLESLPSREEARRALGLGFEPLVIGAVGRLAREKGYDLLFPVMERMWRSYPAAVLAIAGDGPERDRLAALAARATYSNRVRFLGRVDAVTNVYRAADIIVVPSVSEGLGLVALEAMAHERPVVAARVGGLREVIAHSETGLLVDRSADAFADALLPLAAPSPAREGMARCGRVNVERRFAFDRYLDDILAVYRGICA